MTIGAVRPAGADTPFDVTRFSNVLNSELTGRAVGFQFTVGEGHDRVASGAGGIARASIDTQPAPMTEFTEMSIASMSKVITAVAVLQLLDRNHISLDAPVGPFLPAAWLAAPMFRQITFRQLLTHTSGIQSTSTGPLALDYASLRSFATNAPACNPTAPSYPCLAAPGTGRYENANFAYFRLIIPVLAGTSPSPDTGDGWGAAYAQYVRQNVLAPSGPYAATCATDNWSGLDYHYEPAGPTEPGWDLGDLTELCGSQGWVLSTSEYNGFFREVVAPDSTIPYTRWLGGTGAAGTGPTLGALMEMSCIGFAQQVCNGDAGGHSYWAHGGYYPDSGNPGEFNGVTVAFDTGMTVTLFVNSPLAYPFDSFPGDSPLQAVLDAFTTTMAGLPVCGPQVSGAVNWDGSVTVSGSCFTPHTTARLVLQNSSTNQIVSSVSVQNDGTFSVVPWTVGQGCAPGTKIWADDTYTSYQSWGTQSNQVSVDAGCTSQDGWTGGGTGSGSGGPACGPGSWPPRRCVPNMQ
jgi:CubicO group peptidase (beta-lactamase class C family)